ncbi:hypothetical protein C2S52_011143 [Perilla frutescens var. hirtella]|nr:hypothetical protein C2S52_011143 [Perilla frutescens var. hirtella]
MSRTHIIVVHGGVWNRVGDKYENGRQEYVRIPRDGLTYNTLLGLIGNAIDAGNNSSDVYSIMEATNGSNLRMKITDDDDLRHVMEANDILKFYVTYSKDSMNPLSHCPSLTMPSSFVSLLNAQNSFSLPYSYTPPVGYLSNVRPPIAPLIEQPESIVATFRTEVVNPNEHGEDVEKCSSDVNVNVERDEDDIDWDCDWNCDEETGKGDYEGNDDIIDENNTDDDIDDCCFMGHDIAVEGSCGDEDVQDDTWQETDKHGRQWIIPGAVYHVSIPTEELGIDGEGREKMGLGATFVNKEEMCTALGLYHMVNHAEYRTECSSKSRFSAICKQNEECSLLMRAVCCGSIWRVIKFHVPHTCRFDLRCQSPRTVSSMVAATFFAPTLLNEGAILKPKEMQSQLQREYGIELTYERALAARNHAIRMIYGDPDKWGAHVVDMYKKCANSYQTQEFDRHLNNILIASESGAYKRLMDIDPIRWAHCKCLVRRYEFLTSNCAECLNGRLRWARRLPICTLLECVRKLIGHWFAQRHKEASTRNHELTAYAANKVLNNIEQGRTMSVESISVAKFEVTNGMKHYTVDIVGKKCSCKEFDLDQISCSHAAAALSKVNHSLCAYVASYYTTKNLQNMYSKEVMPVVHPEEWDIPLKIQNRIVRTSFNPRQAGRPPISRIQSRSRSASRSHSKVCSRCKKTYHNRLNCTEYIPSSQGLLDNSNETVNEVGSSRSRRRKSCSICHVVGHTRVKCPQKAS